MVLGQSIVAFECGFSGTFVCQDASDFFLHLLIAWEGGFESFPNGERLLVAVGALVDAAKVLRHFEQVSPRGFVVDSALECSGGGIDLAEQDQGLTQVIADEWIFRIEQLGLFECDCRLRVLASLHSKHADDEP